MLRFLKETHQKKTVKQKYLSISSILTCKNGLFMLRTHENRCLLFFCPLARATMMVAWQVCKCILFQYTFISWGTICCKPWRLHSCTSYFFTELYLLGHFREALLDKIRRPSILHQYLSKAQTYFPAPRARERIRIYLEVKKAVTWLSRPIMTGMARNHIAVIYQTGGWQHLTPPRSKLLLTILGFPVNNGSVYIKPHSAKIHLA